MNISLNKSFVSFVKELSAPFTTLLGVIIYIVEAIDKINQISIKLIPVIITVLCLLWVVYVFRKSVSNGESGEEIKTFGHSRTKRVGAILAFIFSLIPYYFIFKSIQPIRINFEVHNNSDSRIELKYLNNYKVLNDFPNYDPISTTGLLSVKPRNSKELNLFIEANSFGTFYGIIQNLNKINNFLDGDHWISLEIKTTEDKIISCPKMIHLTKPALKSGSLQLSYPTDK